MAVELTILDEEWIVGMWETLNSWGWFVPIEVVMVYYWVSHFRSTLVFTK